MTKGAHKSYSQRQAFCCHWVNGGEVERANISFILQDARGIYPLHLEMQGGHNGFCSLRKLAPLKGTQTVLHSQNPLWPPRILKYERNILTTLEKS